MFLGINEKWKRLLELASVGVACFALGAECVLLFSAHKGVEHNWLALSPEDHGISYKMGAVKRDIPLLTPGQLVGRVKFLNRDNGLELGYVATLPIKSLPVSSLPAKYRRTKKLKNGLELGPPDEVIYFGHFEFMLKDADGFTLMTIPGEQDMLYAGKNNSVQGSTKDTVPPSIAKRTKSVLGRFVVEDCNPCD